MIHWHVHSEYSLSDSIIMVPEYVAKVKEMGLKVATLADVGTMSGLVEFWKECKDQDIKPILGMEVLYPTDKTSNNRLVLYAKDRIGFDALVELHNNCDKIAGITKLTDKDLGHEGIPHLLALSSLSTSHFLISVLRGDPDWKYYDYLRGMFGGDFYIELQHNQIPQMQKIRVGLIEHGVNFIPVADAHYLDKYDRLAYDVATGILTNTPVDQKNVYSLPGQDHYLASEEEMLQWFSKDDLSWTDGIGEKIKYYDIGFENWQLPKVAVNSIEEKGKLDIELESYMFDRDDEDRRIYQNRLDYEFSVIVENGFLPYFKMLHGLSNHFDEQGWFRGWGRGSASGSLVSFLYGITKIDPIEWDLYFERFLNPDRISPPDIDLDFMPEHRQAAIEYMREHFGDVYQIGTFGTLGTREVIKSTARIMKRDSKLDRFVPNMAPVPTIKELLKTSEPFVEAARSEDIDFINVITKIEGLKRNRGIHAAGVVISDGGIPLHTVDKGKYRGYIVTGWDMYSLEDLKYTKFDILGVTNLETIHKVAGEVGIEIEDIKLDDQKTFELIKEGSTVGVFQWESDGYKQLIMKLRPDTFEELMDLNTLYRPGPIESGLTDDYIDRKHGKKPVMPIMPGVEFDRQQGLPLYQEDIMAIARDVAGFTLSEADLLRKAIGKKIKGLFEEIKVKFIEGCKQQGKVNPDQAEELWDKIEKFARYTWNKAHAVAYTLISWWTAYLSAHHPEHFFAELLNTAKSMDRRRVIFAECRKRGIKLDNPDVNRSAADFAVVDNAIVIGLRGIKGIGDKTLQKILESRNSNGSFHSLADLKQRTKINKKVVEGLERSGALRNITNYEPTLEEEKEVLGYNVAQRIIDGYWWARHSVTIGEIIDIHKITTKKGAPMAFLQIEFYNRIESLTVFPDMWSMIEPYVSKGKVGHFKGNNDRILVTMAEPEEYDVFKVYVSDPEGFISFCPSMQGKPNIYADGGYGISKVKLDEEMLMFIQKEFGIEKISINRD